MLAELLSALQADELVAALRVSRWVYPLVNAGHIAGLALLIGAVVPLDLRLLGLWRGVPVAVLARPLLAVAICGLLLTLACGVLLFSVQATKYAAMPLFRLKLLLIGAAVANALLLRVAPDWQRQWGDAPPAPSARLKTAGLLSIALWLSVLLCGRLIAYQ